MKGMEQRAYSGTTRFVMPILGLSKETVFNDSYIGSFIYSDTALEVEDNIIIVYSTPQSEILEASTSSQQYNKFYLYFFTNDTIKSHIKLFKEGKYSKFTVKEKLAILNFWGLDKTSKMHSIMNPKDYAFETGLAPALLGKMKEIWPKPVLSNETFKAQQEEE